jgi:hypothetical protein
MTRDVGERPVFSITEPRGKAQFRRLPSGKTDGKRRGK